MCRRIHRTRAVFPAIPLLALALAACGRPPSGTAEQAPSAAPVASASAAAPPEPSAAPPASSAAPAQPEPPAGYLSMHVLEVAATPAGAAVLLVGGDEARVLPIFIGGTEALSIRLRLDKERFQRPLTHDLLDALVGRLGGSVWKVHVDELRGTTFVGTVFVRQGDRVIDVDARPSDAIALALGSGVPIYVSRKVVESAGLSKKDLEERGEGALEAPPGSNPISL